MTPYHLPKKRSALKSTPKISLFWEATFEISHNHHSSWKQCTITSQARSSTPPNSTKSNPSKNTHGNPKKWKKGSVTSENLNESRNASRYKKALRFAESQSSMHGPIGQAGGDWADSSSLFVCFFFFFNNFFVVVNVKVFQWQQKAFLLVLMIAEVWLNYVYFGNVELW